MSENPVAAPSMASDVRSRARPGRPPWDLSVGAVLVAALFALPGGYVLWRALTGGALHLLTERRSLEPLWRTVQLAFLVSASAALLGTVLAQQGRANPESGFRETKTSQLVAEKFQELGIPHQRDFHRHIAAYLCGLDVQVDDAGMGGEWVGFAGDAVVEPHGQTYDNVGLVNG